MTTFEGWMPTGAVAAFDFSMWTRSTWMTHFFRYTWVTLPSRPLYFPRIIKTSSSLRMGIERAWQSARRSHLLLAFPMRPRPRFPHFRNLARLFIVGWTSEPTECLPRSSLLNGEDMIFRLMPEGAEKCALRDLRRSEARPNSQYLDKFDDSPMLHNHDAKRILSGLAGAPTTLTSSDSGTVVASDRLPNLSTQIKSSLSVAVPSLPSASYPPAGFSKAIAR